MKEKSVLEVKKSVRVMSLKLEIEGVMFIIVSGYAPKVGCALEEKEKFWSDVLEVMLSILRDEREMIAADFSGHVGEDNRDDEEVMGSFGVQDRNAEGQMVKDFAKRMEMPVVNTFFQKRQEHGVTYKTEGRSTQVQVDYFLWKLCNLRCFQMTGQLQLDVIRETDRRALGVSSGTNVDEETWWWNEEVQEYVQRRR